MEHCILKLEHVSKWLGHFCLEDMDFELPKGYICGLAGQNGAGKTTLLHLILGLYTPELGEVTILGKNYRDAEKELHDRTGCVLVEELYHPHLTLMKNADYYGEFYTGYDREGMKQYLERFQLAEEEKYGKLSRGQKLKFQLAFALAHHPSLLVCDEPTGNFDPEFRSDFFDILREFIRDGERSVILATHLTEDLDAMADYLIYLEEGKQIFAGDMESFREQYRIVRGERYKVRLIPEEKRIYLEEGSYGTKALVRHSQRDRYDGTLTVTSPSIEEFMYFYSKRIK